MPTPMITNGSTRLSCVLANSTTPKMTTSFAKKQNTRHFDFQFLAYLTLAIVFMLPIVAPAEIRKSWKRQHSGRVGLGLSDYNRGRTYALDDTPEDFPESLYTGDDVIGEILHPEKKKNRVAFATPIVDDDRNKRSFTAKSAQYGCVHTWKLPCK